jgi:hypothetical protein
MPPAHCPDCTRLSNDIVTLRWARQAARDALALTSPVDGTYAERWTRLVRVSDQLTAAETLERRHREHHLAAEPATIRRQDRRVATVSDRRRIARGGRRSTDDNAYSQPALVACTACPIGTAGLLERSPGGDQATVTYRCWDCGHQFDRLAES